MSSGKGKNRKPAIAPKFWTPTRIGITCAATLAVALVASAFFSGKTTAPPPSTPRTNPRSANRPATLTELLPEAMDSRIELLGGKSMKLSDYSGKVIVLDLWATWCGPCRQEIPYLKALATEFKDKGLHVIGLTTEDKTRDLDAVNAFVKEFKINYPVGWANREIAMNVMAGRGAIPQTVVIGKDGKVKKHLVGFNLQVAAPQLRRAVEEAVAE